MVYFNVDVSDLNDFANFVINQNLNNFMWKININYSSKIKTKDVIFFIRMFEKALSQTPKTFLKFTLVTDLPICSFEKFEELIPTLYIPDINVVPQDTLTKYYEMVYEIYECFTYDGLANRLPGNTGIFPWEDKDDISNIIIMLNSLLPLQGFFLALSTKELWILPKDSVKACSIHYDSPGNWAGWFGGNKTLFHAKSSAIYFDIFGGFRRTSQVLGETVLDPPQELKNAFQTWVKNNRAGPVITGFL